MDDLRRTVALLEDRSCRQRGSEAGRQCCRGSA
jgi:hypothetical protein